jgi:hypothetical protein
MKEIKEIAIELLVIFLFCFLTSCKTRTVYVPVERVHTETVTLKDTVIEVKIDHIRDSVAVCDSASYISNKYAYSWAVMKSGLLTHSLGTWPASIPVEVRYSEKLITDSIPVPYEVTAYVYKEKSLTWWQKTRMLAGDLCLFTLAGIILSFLVRYFLKKKL